MISFPNGKINIGLSITGKRPDGYHNIETIMVPVKINDVLEIIVATGKDFSFNLSGLNIPGESGNNLVCKAYELLREKFNLPPVNIHLHKVIPVGAGLGGGSSDGAFTIKMINSIFKLNLSIHLMEEYARILGSDCAFFIVNKPVLAYNRGDEFQDVEIDLSKYFLTIVKPELQISTPDAYSWIKPSQKKYPFMKLNSYPLHQWKEMIWNDFEPEISSRFPVIRDIISKLYEQGAVYASLTGSGAAVYGIFDQQKDIRDQFPECYVWSGRSSIL